MMIMLWGTARPYIMQSTNSSTPGLLFSTQIFFSSEMEQAFTGVSVSGYDHLSLLIFYFDEFYLGQRSNGIE